MNNIFFDECRKDLLKNHGGDSTTQVFTIKVRSSNVDNKLKTNLSIIELWDRLKNVISELELIHENFHLI